MPDETHSLAPTPDMDAAALAMMQPDEDGGYDAISALPDVDDDTDDMRIADYRRRTIRQSLDMERAAEAIMVLLALLPVQTIADRLVRARALQAHLHLVIDDALAENELQTILSEHRAGIRRNGATLTARKPDNRSQADADRCTMRLVEMGGLVRRRSGWRFGTKRVPDKIVDRLAAAGRVRIEGDRCVSASHQPAE